MDFALFRMAIVVVALLGLLFLWKRPRPLAALGLLIAVNLAAWATYVAPLKRLYALGEGSDRGFSVGMASCVAAGNPWGDHVQVGFAALEPFWNIVVAALALFRPERVLTTYHWMTPLALIFVSLGLYFGLRHDDGEADAWERLLVVFAVLGLSSFSLSQRPPLPALWAGLFLGKPNHACAWGIVGLVLGWRARAARAWVVGLTLGLLAWAHLLYWAYLVTGLAAGVCLRPRERRRRDGIALATAVGVSFLSALPDIFHLLKDYNPFSASGGSPKQMWREPLGQILAAPHWGTVDLGVLLVLGALGAFVLRRRASTRDLDILGLMATAWGLWLAYEIGALFTFTPKPDQSHYFQRFTMALAAGSALAAAARHLEERLSWTLGRGHLLALAACLPMSFWAYWDPPSMDRYFRWNLKPIPQKAVAYGEWVRKNTSRDAVFLAGPSASTWIPVFSGRRVLLAGAYRPPADYRERKSAERVLLTSRDPDAILRTARAYGITHLAVDWPLMDEYGVDALKEIGRVPVYEPVFFNSAVRILKVRSSPRGGPPESSTEDRPLLPEPPSSEGGEE